MKAVIAVLSGISLLFMTQMVQAWNKPGHMIAAAIAYSDLKELHPDVLARVVEILKEHPDFKSKWADKLSKVKADDRDLHLLMLAARWPDDARGDLRYDHPDWHYVNIPYRPGDAGVHNPPNDGIMKVFPENQSIAKSSNADNSARAVALCWMFHLIGDVHQPLHTTKLVTDQFPEPGGDRGGTRFCIRVKPSSKTISLHQFWDGLILGSDRFQTVRNEAMKLRNMSGLKREDFSEELAVQPFNDWAVAAHNVAIKQAYRNGTLQGSTSKSNGVVLPGDYKDEAKESAERQLVLSAYRISDSMIEIFGK